MKLEQLQQLPVVIIRENAASLVLQSNLNSDGLKKKVITKEEAFLGCFKRA